MELWRFGRVDNDGLYKLLGPTLISYVCESSTSRKHVDDDETSSNYNLSVIPMSPNKFMDCMDLVGK